MSSPAIYKKQGIRFLYPGNWKVTDDVEQEGVRYLFVESPGDAIFSAQIYIKQDAVSLHEFAEWFSDYTRQDIPIGSIGQSSFSAVERSLASGKSEGVKENFSMKLLGVQIPHIREYYLLDANTKAAFLISQLATEDLSMVEPGFDLILSSFVIE